ncbi:hypothetical protein ACFL47_09065 [Candidatus Latescibacterota bacterium]
MTSLHPLYEKENVVYHEDLIGSWRENGNSETWMFKEGKDKSYRLIIFDEETSGEFEVHMVQLGAYTFLDILPEYRDDMNWVWMVHLIPTHSFMRVTVANDTLKIAPLDLEWFGKVYEQGKITLEYVENDDMGLLISPTDKLQEFVVEYAEKEEAFPFEELYRLK